MGWLNGFTALRSRRLILSHYTTIFTHFFLSSVSLCKDLFRYGTVSRGAWQMKELETWWRNVCARGLYVLGIAMLDKFTIGHMYLVASSFRPKFLSPQVKNNWQLRQKWNHTHTYTHTLNRRTTFSWSIAIGSIAIGYTSTPQRKQFSRSTHPLQWPPAKHR